jgi:hypothetical protein
MRIGRGNRSTRRKPAPAPLCPPQIPHDLTWARIRAAEVGSRRLTAWTRARSTFGLLARLPFFYDVLTIVSWRENKSAMTKDAQRKKWRKKKQFLFPSPLPPSFLVTKNGLFFTFWDLGSTLNVRTQKHFLCIKLQQNGTCNHFPGSAFCFVCIRQSRILYVYCNAYYLKLGGNLLLAFSTLLYNTSLESFEKVRWIEIEWYAPASGLCC